MWWVDPRGPHKEGSPRPDTGPCTAPMVGDARRMIILPILQLKKITHSEEEGKMKLIRNILVWEVFFSLWRSDIVGRQACWPFAICMEIRAQCDFLFHRLAFSHFSRTGAQRWIHPTTATAHTIPSSAHLGKACLESQLEREPLSGRIIGQLVFVFSRKCVLQG